MNRREKIKELRAALDSAFTLAHELRRKATEAPNDANVDRAMRAEAAAADAEFRLNGFLESREPRELRKGDVIEVDRYGDARNGDDVCRLVRGPRKVRGEFVLYVVPAAEPEEGDEEAWENEDVEELPVRSGERFRLVSRKEKGKAN